MAKKSINSRPKKEEEKHEEKYGSMAPASSLAQKA